MSRVRELRDQLVERNLFVHASLGLLAFGRRLEGFVARYLLAPPAAPPGYEIRSAEATSPGAVPIAVLGVLGALSMVRRIESVLGDWALEAQQISGACESGGYRSAGPRDLLR